MPQRSVASTYTFEQQRTEINLLAADFWSQKGTVDTASTTYLKHDGSNDFTGGTLAVPNAFTINSNSGNGTVTIAGNLQVNGTTTTVNTATMDVVDKNITIAKGSANDAAADGAGITIDSATDITLNFVDNNDAWVSSIGLEATTFLKGPYGQFTGSGTPTTGQGVEVNAPDANTGQIASYDRGNTAYKELRVKGSSVGVYTGTTNALRASFNSSGLEVEAGDLRIPNDTGKVTCGQNADLQLYHDGGSSVIQNINNNASLYLKASSTGTDNIKCYANGGTHLYWNGVSGLYTAEDANNAGVPTVRIPDDVKLKMGNASDFLIFHHGTEQANYIESKDNVLYICGKTGQTAVQITPDGATDLRHSGLKKLETTSSGLNIHEDADKVISFSGGIGEIGSVPGFQGSNTAGTALTSLGMRGVDLRFATGSSERVRIRATGQVEFSNGSFSDDVNCVMASGSTLEIGATSTIKLRTATNERLQIDSSGSVHVGFGGESLYFQNGFNNSTARIQNAGATNNSDLRFLTRDAGTENERMRITADGHVRIQHATTNAKILLSRNVSVDTDDTSTGVIDFANNTAHTVNSRIMGKTSGTGNVGGQLVVETRDESNSVLDERLRIDSSGRVLIGATSTTSPARLAVNGCDTGAEAFFDLNRTDDPASGQNIGVIEFSQGNSASRNAARIITRRDGGVWGASSLPTRFEFHACNSGSNSPTERMRITSTGAVQMEYLNPADGSTAARAARSAVEIKKYYPNSPTGNYWIIAPNGQGAKQIRCDMETDGGGWMLWYAHNSYGSNNMNEQCGGTSASPSSNIDKQYMGDYVKYTCWMEASKIDDGDYQKIDSFVQLDQNGQIRYKADYGEEFFPEEVGNPFNPSSNSCFTANDSEWWGGNSMYPPTCGTPGNAWTTFSGGGWSRIWIREPESDISPGTVRNCHGIARVYGRDHDGVPSWYLHDSSFIEPIWSNLIFNNNNLTQGNGNWISENGRAIGDLSQSNNGDCASARLKGYLTGEFEITFNLGYAWGWSLISLMNSRSMAERFSDAVGTGQGYGPSAEVKGAYSLYNNSSNNQWMPAKRNGAGVWTEYQNVPGAPQNVDNIMWRESDGTIKVRRADGTHGIHTFDQKWAGPFMVVSANQSPCFINIKEIYDGKFSWEKWYK